MKLTDYLSNFSTFRNELHNFEKEKKVEIDNLENVNFSNDALNEIQKRNIEEKKNSMIKVINAQYDERCTKSTENFNSIFTQRRLDKYLNSIFKPKIEIIETFLDSEVSLFDARGDFSKKFAVIFIFFQIGKHKGICIDCNRFESNTSTLEKYSKINKGDIITVKCRLVNIVSLPEEIKSSKSFGSLFILRKVSQNYSPGLEVYLFENQLLLSIERLWGKYADYKFGNYSIRGIFDAIRLVSLRKEEPLFVFVGSITNESYEEDEVIKEDIKVNDSVNSINKGANHVNAGKSLLSVGERLLKGLGGAWAGTNFGGMVGLVLGLGKFIFTLSKSSNGTMSEWISSSFMQGINVALWCIGTGAILGFVFGFLTGKTLRKYW